MTRTPTEGVTTTTTTTTAARRPRRSEKELAEEARDKATANLAELDSRIEKAKAHVSELEGRREPLAKEVEWRSSHYLLKAPEVTVEEVGSISPVALGDDPDGDN